MIGYLLIDLDCILVFKKSFYANSSIKIYIVNWKKFKDEQTDFSGIESIAGSVHSLEFFIELNALLLI